MSVNKRSTSNIIQWLYTEKHASGMTWSDFDHTAHKLKPADIILIDGNTPADKRIKKISGSSWSQAMLYLGRLHEIKDPALRALISTNLECQSNTQIVLKADLLRGVHLISLSELRNAHLRVCRPRSLSIEEKLSVIRYALTRLEYQNKSAWWPAIRLLIVPWAFLPARWRRSLFTLIAGRRLRRALGGVIGESFSFIQYPILPLIKPEQEHKVYRQYPSVFYPADFDLSPYFDVLKIPFAARQQEVKHRLVPWAGEIGVLDSSENKNIQEGIAKITELHGKINQL